MCIAVPVPIVDISGGIMPMGHVSHLGVNVDCCFAYVPEAKVGDYVIVQNGFAIELLDPQSAAESLAIFADYTESVSANSGAVGDVTSPPLASSVSVAGAT